MKEACDAPLPPVLRVPAGPLSHIMRKVWGLGFGVWGLGFGVWGLAPAAVAATTTSAPDTSALWRARSRFAIRFCLFKLPSLASTALPDFSSTAMDPVTMGLLKLGAHLFRTSAVVDNVNATVRFFMTFDKNGDKELDPDEISAALEVRRRLHCCFCGSPAPCRRPLASNTRAP